MYVYIFARPEYDVTTGLAAIFESVTVKEAFLLACQQIDAGHHSITYKEISGIGFFCQIEIAAGNTADFRLAMPGGFVTCNSTV